MNESAVSEIEQPERQTLSRLDVGMLIVLGSMAIAGLLGLIAVLTAENDFEALGVGFGVVWAMVVAGGTIACGLACLVRGRLGVLALGALGAAGLAVDLAVLGILLDLDNEAYLKLVGVAFVGSVFGLVVLGLALACSPRDTLARSLYYATVGLALLGAALAAVMILSSGAEDVVAAARPVPFGLAGDLLRPLAATMVVLAALWVAALAASRVERPADA